MADYRKIEAAFQERDARIKRLTEDLQRVNSDMSLLKDEMNQLLKKKVLSPPCAYFDCSLTIVCL